MQVRFVLLVAALSAATFAPASAQTAVVAAAPVDCATTNASSMSSMSPVAPVGAAPASPAAADAMTIDRQFATSMQAMIAHASQMSQIEAACGKNDKVRGMAAKMVDDLQNYAIELQRMRARS